MERGRLADWGIALYTTLDIGYLVALTAIGGISKAYQGMIRMTLETALGPFGSFIWNSLFYFWPLLTCLIIRKFGVGTISAVVGGFIEIALGNPYGIMVIYYNLVEGFAADLGMLAFKYNIEFNKKGLLKCYVAGVIAALFGAVVFAATLGLFVYGLEAIVIYYAGSILFGGGVVAGALSFAVASILAKAGIGSKSVRQASRRVL